jgi:hypothetical protein
METCARLRNAEERFSGAKIRRPVRPERSISEVNFSGTPGPSTCPTWHAAELVRSGLGQRNRKYRKVTADSPPSGDSQSSEKHVGVVDSIREGEAPAEPHTTETITT